MRIKGIIKISTIKSKERITKFGEVFTSEREVHAMLDLVENETLRIDSRFLEPACGDGNFLIEILRRKIEIVKKKYSNNQIEFERYAFTAITSLYGVDILEDNVFGCRQRLENFLIIIFKEHFDEVNQKFWLAIKFVLSKNIIHGDALTLTIPGKEEPIIFSEWCFTTGSKVKRTEYTLSDILAYQPFEDNSLFSDFGEEVIIPKPTQSYSQVHFLELQDEA